MIVKRGASPLRYSAPFENTMRHGIDEPCVIASRSARAAPEGWRPRMSARPAWWVGNGFMLSLSLTKVFTDCRTRRAGPAGRMIKEAPRRTKPRTSRTRAFSRSPSATHRRRHNAPREGHRLTDATERLAALPRDALATLSRGIEKESLRVRSDGTLDTRPHPAELGSALTHPHITTDFSESQLELITGVQPSVAACLRELTEIHQFVYRHIDGDALWSSSMPCRLPPDDDIPIGRYGESNVGRLKTIYRKGLSHRYGRRMQTISGVHYNFSLPEDAMAALQAADGDAGSPSDYRTRRYFATIRNFRRHSWLPLYLFGASPAVGRSFVDGRPHRLEALSADTLYLPHATSLR